MSNGSESGSQTKIFTKWDGSKFTDTIKHDIKSVTGCGMMVMTTNSHDQMAREPEPSEVIVCTNHADQIMQVKAYTG